MKLYYLTYSDSNNLHQTRSSLQLTTKGCESLSLTLIEILLTFTPRRHFFQTQLKIISKRNLRKVTKC